MRLRPVVFALVCLAVAFGASAGKQRSVKPLDQVIFQYAIYDAATAKPVVGAEVTSGNATGLTDAGGEFRILVPINRPVGVTVHRTGYSDLAFTVVASVPPSAPVSYPSAATYAITLPNGGSTVQVPAPPPAAGPPPAPAPTLSYIPLSSKPPVSIRFTNDLTARLDAETVQFAYVVPFATPEASNAASLCRADGTSWTPDRSEFATITGPAKKISNSACCKLGQVLAVDVKMRSGETATVSFNDSCYGYDIVLSGRDHETAQYVYFKLTDVALVTFP